MRSVTGTTCRRSARRRSDPLGRLDSSSSKRRISSGATSARLSASISKATCQPLSGMPCCLARSSMSSFSVDSEISSSARSSARDLIGSSRAFRSSSASRAAASGGGTEHEPCGDRQVSMGRRCRESAQFTGGRAQPGGSRAGGRASPPACQGLRRTIAHRSPRSALIRPARSYCVQACARPGKGTRGPATHLSQDREQQVRSAPQPREPRSARGQRDSRCRPRSREAASAPPQRRPPPKRQPGRPSAAPCRSGSPWPTRMRPGPG